MKKNWCFFLLLFFTNNLFSQIANKDAIKKSEGLSVVTRIFSTDFYLYNQGISTSEVEELIWNDPSAQRYYIYGKNLRTFGNILSVSSGVVFGVALSLSQFSEDRTVLVASAGALILGIFMDNRGRFNLRKSVDAYNHSDSYGLKIDFTENGLGLIFNF